MRITIASGKGGTGKTFVALNLAFSLQDEVNLVDCDVEEPNLHLFLKPTITQEDRVYQMVPKVEEEKCNQCKKCVLVCAYHALTLLNEKILIFPELCHGCRSCLLFCPQKAILEEYRELGVVEKGIRGKIHFYQGRLNIGEALAPPVIQYLKKRWEWKGYTILDSSPGTSCPVIETVKGSDYIILVTEPTPFGLHDLKLALGMCRLLEQKVGLIINRCDIGDKSVLEYAQKEHLPVLLSIPYHERIAKSYAQGEILVENDPYFQSLFQSLWSRIRR